MWHDWQRRTLLRGSLALALGSLLPRPLRAEWRPTPALTEGPFYPVELPADADADLLRVAGQEAPALGQPLHLSVQVLDVGGLPQAGARVEIWQCDSAGAYRHPAAGGQGSDPGFQGYGSVLTGDDGGCRFRTIRPVPYAGRTPHVHVKVATADGRRLTTQMFVAGEPLNEDDFLWQRLGERAALVTVPLSAAPGEDPPALAGTFVVVLPAAA